MLSEVSQAAYIALLLIFVPLPYAVDRKIERIPWVTYGLIATNFMVFALLVLPNIGTTHENDVFDLWGVVPRAPKLADLITYVFIHVSLAHLLWNSAFLWLFGPSGEDALGHVPFLIFYLSGGVVAGLLHIAIVLLFAQDAAVAYAPMVGASGAISAVVGLYALRFYRSKLRVVWLCAWFMQLRTARFELPALAGLGLWFLQTLANAVISLFQPDRNGIAYWAHIGGFVFGMAIAEIMGMFGEGIREYLFADAVVAGEQGEHGIREAVRNFQLLLLRRPDDSEVRVALALLAHRPQPSDSVVMIEAVSEAYSMLLEQSLSLGDLQRAEEWRAAFDELRADDIVSGTVLVRIAERAWRAGDVVLAERLYEKVRQRFPESMESDQATLDTAALVLENQGSPSAAVAALNLFISKGQ